MKLPSTRGPAPARLMHPLRQQRLHGLAVKLSKSLGSALKQGHSPKPVKPHGAKLGQGAKPHKGGKLPGAKKISSSGLGGSSSQDPQTQESQEGSPEEPAPPD